MILIGLVDKVEILISSISPEYENTNKGYEKVNLYLIFIFWIIDVNHSNHDQNNIEVIKLAGNYWEHFMLIVGDKI